MSSCNGWLRDKIFCKISILVNGRHFRPVEVVPSPTYCRTCAGQHGTVKSFLLLHDISETITQRVLQCSKGIRWGERETEREMKRVLKVNRLSEWKWLSAECSRWILSQRQCPPSVMRKTGESLLFFPPSFLSSLSCPSLSISSSKVWQMGCRSDLGH